MDMMGIPVRVDEDCHGDRAVLVPDTLGREQIRRFSFAITALICPKCHWAPCECPEEKPA